MCLFFMTPPNCPDTATLLQPQVPLQWLQLSKERKYPHTEQVQTVCLLLFPKQYSMMTMSLVFMYMLELQRVCEKVHSLLVHFLYLFETEKGTKNPRAGSLPSAHNC